ncbi:MAG TPA: SDR family NAD(P)-dependent oxidoreductase [Kofleriaceae bacterium]|nr:SDR family NAD(P)-dependent oxidoreductase [Kofleriaceae bacterium]
MAREPLHQLAVVTGASSGIGFELARQCVEHGFDVLICAEDAGIATAATRLAASDRRVIALQADLAMFDGVEALNAAIEGTHRPVDALLLNAAVGVGGPFVETALVSELEMIALNCAHTVHLAKYVVPGMVARGRGRILITGSVASAAPTPFHAVYAATKAFVLSFGEALREELKGTGVTVTVLHPGASDAELFERAALARAGIDAMLAGREAN